MLSGDLETHTDDAACRAGDMHSFLITAAKTGTLDAAPKEGDQVLMLNDPASTALLTVEGTTREIGEFGTSTTLSPGESLCLAYNGTKWLVALLTRIPAAPGWHKIDVDYTQVQIAATTKIVTLLTLPIKGWVHAVAWKAPADWAPGEGAWSAEGELLRVSIRDEDSADVFLNNGQLGAVGAGWSPSAIEGHAVPANSPEMYSATAAKGIEAYFELVNPSEGDTLDDLTAGTLEVWLLISSMNGGAG